MVLVLKNPPANAGGHGFDPWSGKIPHAYALQLLRPLQLEKAWVLQRRPRRVKNK